MRADAGFGAPHAYYRYVSAPKSGSPATSAAAARSRRGSNEAFFGADFSTHNGFPAATQEARTRERLEERARHLADFSEFAADGRPTVIEVWRILPPSGQVLAAARLPDGCTFRLLHGDVPPPHPRRHPL